MVQVFGHRHENFQIRAAAPEGDFFNKIIMDVSICSPFSWDGYAASRSHAIGFKEHLTGKSKEVLLRKILAQHDPSLGCLSIEWKMNQKQQVKAQWETHGRKHKQKAIKRNQFNRGEITNASPSATGCLLTLQKLMSRILPCKAGLSSEFKKSQVEGQEIAPQNIIC